MKIITIDTTKPKSIEKVFAVFSLMAFSQALIPLLITSDGEKLVESGGSRLLQIIWLFIYILTVYFLSKDIKRVVYTLLTEKTILGLLLYAALSITWSADFALTLQRVVALFGSTCFGAYFALRFTIKQQIVLLAWAFGLNSILSLIACIFFPYIGTMQRPVIYIGSWRGIFTHKNILARLMNYSGLIFLILLVEAKTRVSRISALFFLSLSVFLIIMSTSVGPLLTLIILMLIVPFLRSLRWSYGYTFSFLFLSSVIVGSSLVFLFANLDVFFELIGKDPTLTGRTDLWADLIGAIQERPLLGYGFSGFWRGWAGISGDIWNLNTWLPPDAHSGFLDLFLELGLIGFLIYLIGYLKTLFKAFMWTRLTTSAYDLWPIIFIISIIFFNISESALLRSNTINWIIYTSVAFTVSVRKPTYKV